MVFCKLLDDNKKANKINCCKLNKKSFQYFLINKFVNLGE